MHPGPPDAAAGPDARRFDNGLDISNAPDERLRTNGVGPGRGARDRSPLDPRPSSSDSRQNDMPKPPERRRPPMLGGREGSGDVPIPAPLSSPRFGAQNRNQPSQDSLDAVAKMPGGFASTPTPTPSPMNDREVPVPAPLQIHSPPLKSPTPPAPRPQQREPEPPAPIPDPSPSEEPVQSPVSEDDYRPGLGPMFKRKGQAEVTNKWKKAAGAAKTAAAFKPRAGGALDRLRKMEEQEAGDGITGVFQAPKPAPPSRSTTDESLVKSATERDEPAAAAVQPINTQVAPPITVSSPLSPTPVIQKSAEDAMPPPLAPRQASPELPPARTPAEKEEARRKRRRSQYQAKYLSSLGIEASLIDTRALEFDAILSDFGWGGSGVGSVFQNKKLDVIEADLRRELSRAEAGSWLGNGVGMEQKDDRVEQVERLLDKAIQECEELEGLLTLYGVELSVSERKVYTTTIFTNDLCRA